MQMTKRVANEPVPTDDDLQLCGETPCQVSPFPPPPLRVPPQRRCTTCFRPWKTTHLLKTSCGWFGVSASFPIQRLAGGEVGKEKERMAGPGGSGKGYAGRGPIGKKKQSRVEGAGIPSYHPLSSPPLKKLQSLLRSHTHPPPTPRPFCHELVSASDPVEPIVNWRSHCLIMT